MDQKEQSPSISLRSVILISSSIMIGTVQFGFAMTSWNAQQTPFMVRYSDDWGCIRNEIHDKNYVCDDAILWSSGVLTATIAGGTISSIASAFYLPIFSKRTLIYIMNLFIVLGSGIAFIDNMIAIYIGKALIGIAIGGFSVTCPKYMMDFVPARLKVAFTQWPAGTLALGMFVPALASLPIPDRDALAGNQGGFFVQHYWRVVWAIPILFAFIQVALLFFVVPSAPIGESPPPLAESELPVETDEILSTRSPDLTWYQTFCDRRTRRAAWVGFLLSSAQHTSGQIGLAFYSADIFEKIGFSAVIGILIVRLFNLLAAVPSFFVIRHLGRRTAQLLSMTALCVTLTGMGIFVVLDIAEPLIVCMVLFVISSHLGALPIGWIYVLEVSNDKGVAVAMAWNWFLRLITSIFVKALFQNATVGKYSFFMFGALNAVVTVLIFFYMKETKNLPVEELGRLFLRPEKRVLDKI